MYEINLESSNTNNFGTGIFQITDAGFISKYVL